MANVTAIRKITLDVSRPNETVINVKQGDENSRYLNIKVTNVGNVISIPPDTVVTLNARNFAGDYANSMGEVDADGTVTVLFTPAMTATPGRGKADIQFIGSGGERLSALNFIYYAEEQAVPDGAVITDSNYSALVGALAEVAGFAGVKAEVETARGTYESVDARLDAVDQEAFDQAGDIASLGGRLTTAEQSIGTLDSGLTGALQRIADSEEAIPVMQDDISTLQETTLMQTADIAAIKQQTVTKYGVRFGGSANTGATVTRLFNAVGLVAGVGTDTVTATNDFDNIYPWSNRRRCCGNFDASGKFIVNAYKGEPGYAEDGSNGEVWVELPLFYYKHTYGADDSEEIIISAFPIGGYLPAPVFINKDGTVKQKAYVAAYPMATIDGKATSRSGVFSDVCSLNTAMTTARTLGANYTTQTTAEWYTRCLFMWVEFATRNLQNIMNGASSMPYTATHTAVIAETGVSRVILSNANAAQYVVGQTIIIGTSLGSTNIANNRILTAIETYDADNKALVFDGEAVNIAVGNIVCTSAYKNGSCDGVLSSSGSPVSNTDGKHNCIYRGEETPYGNAFEWISDVLFKREGAGTTESPYIYDIYFLEDPTKYAAGAITADYKKLNFRLPGTEGYVKKLGYDSRFPFARIPTESGASTTTYYSDYYYAPAYAITAARVGGYWHNGAYAGPCSWACYNAPSSSLVSFRARLSYHRS